MSVFKGQFKLAVAVRCGERSLANDTHYTEKWQRWATKSCFDLIGTWTLLT